MQKCGVRIITPLLSFFLCKIYSYFGHFQFAKYATVTKCANPASALQCLLKFQS